MFPTALFFNKQKTNENKDADSKESEEYEDDFGKGLEWLINGKGNSDASTTEMIYEKEENVNKELKENEAEIEDINQLFDPDTSLKDEISPRQSDFISVPNIQYLDPISDSDMENSS
ncbi:hypothetical protein TREES_T100007070 [Tupaia chinensis]|uniref:Coiled-coil domain-containing protein 181 n=1 Tax=Tupaia chinensis TaxID=246437 RepID=L9LC79_TUPCH|nr:hypothetical protein TREES_T100007070 [Tupaia chinensis]